MPKIFVAIVRRNSCLITLGSGRTKFPKNFRYQLTQEKSLGFAKGRGNLLGGGGWVPGKAKIQECIELVVTAFWTYQMFKARK